MTLTKCDLAAIGLAVLVPILAYFGYFRHRVGELGALTEQATTLEHETGDDYKTARDIAAARRDIRRLRERLDEFFGSVATEDKAYKAVDAILRNAKEAGVQIEAVRPETAVEGKTLNCLPITLTASADFAALHEFLRRVETGSAVITVEQMELESDPVSDLCGVTVELRVYFAKSAIPESPRP